MTKFEQNFDDFIICIEKALVSGEFRDYLFVKKQIKIFLLNCIWIIILTHHFHIGRIIFWQLKLFIIIFIAKLFMTCSDFNIKINNDQFFWFNVACLAIISYSVQSSRGTLRCSYNILTVLNFILGKPSRPLLISYQWNKLHFKRKYIKKFSKVWSNMVAVVVLL